MRCFSRKLISNVHKSIIVTNSIDILISRIVFEADQKTRSTSFIGSGELDSLLCESGSIPELISHLRRERFRGFLSIFRFLTMRKLGRKKKTYKIPRKRLLRRRTNQRGFSLLLVFLFVPRGFSPSNQGFPLRKISTFPNAMSVFDCSTV